MIPANNSIYRDEDERRFETLNIIYQLKQNKIDSKIPGIRLLLEYLTNYVKDGKSQTFEIDVPEIQKRIHGKLPILRKMNCEVVMKAL